MKEVSSNGNFLENIVLDGGISCEHIDDIIYMLLDCEANIDESDEVSPVFNCVLIK